MIKFSSVFTGEEVFLTDHKVMGRKVLPGVAYLEMARAALEAAAWAGQKGIRFKNIVWASPLVVDEEPVKVNITLEPQENGEINYKVYSEPDGLKEVLHSQGIAGIFEAKEEEIIDIKALRGKKWARVITSGECYAEFAKSGLEYGEGHRGIESVYSGEDEALARLVIPVAVKESAGEYMLHPSMLDSALQAVIGLDNGKGGVKALPFAIDEVEVSGRSETSMWAIVSAREEGTRRKIDIELCNDLGKVRVKIKGLSLRSGMSQDKSPAEECIILSPVWDVKDIKRTEAPAVEPDGVLLIGGSEEAAGIIGAYYTGARMLSFKREDGIETITEKLKETGRIGHIVWIAPESKWESIDGEEFIDGQEDGVIEIFRIIKALLSLGYGTKDLFWSVITSRTQRENKEEGSSPVHSSVEGLIGSMAKEYPNWKVRMADLGITGEWTADEIFRLPADPDGNPLAYRGGRWYAKKLIPVKYPAAGGTLYREGGVYAVIGGAGGIGEVWSEHMIRKYRARIVWIGRREKDEAIQSKIEKLGLAGEPPWYIRADARDRSSLDGAYNEIKAKYTEINGVVHSAIVLQDQSLAKMDEEKFREGLSAKVDVSVRIAQVFKKESLDFVMFFSSIQSFSKNAGQCNYAAGCTFEDAYAAELSRERNIAVKVMNWGYWGSVGIVSSKEYLERMAQAGIGSIEPREGMDALEKLMSGPPDQIALMKISKPLVLKGLGAGSDFMEVLPQYPAMDGEDVFSRITPDLTGFEKIKAELIPHQKKIDGLLAKLLWVELGSMGWLQGKRTELSGKYCRWMDESVRALETFGFNVNDPVLADKEEAWKEWEIEKGNWTENPGMKTKAELAELMLRRLTDILKGEIQATDIMFPDSSMKLVEGIYKNNEISDFFNKVMADCVSVYMEERSRKDPSAGLRIIEIGAGTGGTSAFVLEKLKDYKGNMEEYCYTDISRAFLMHGEKEYGPDNPFLTYKIFNSEEPVDGQGLKPGSYDIVIAANVLHATRNIRITLRNAKALLKKNGVILLNEINGKSLFLHVTFGLLEGWWLYEDEDLRMPGSPGLKPESWKKVLESEGFRPVIYPVEEAHNYGQQIIAAFSDGIVRQKYPKEKAVIPQIRHKNKTVPQRKKIVKGGDVTDQMINDHVRFAILESIVKELKIEEDKIQYDKNFSEYGLDSILAVRLINSVNKELSIVLNTIVLFDYNNVELLTEYIAREHRQDLIKGLSENAVENENMETGFPDDFETFKEDNETGIPQKYDGYYRTLIEGPGQIKDLKIIKSDVPLIRDEEIRIAVHAFSLNFGDLLCLKGLYPTMPPYPFTPGFEVSGVIVETGKSVASFREGDEVVALTGGSLGGHSTMVTCPEQMVFIKPEILSFEEACSLPVVAITMIAAFQKARLKKGEKILIQTATGGTGLIAVQLAQYYGAEIYATASLQNKLDYLEKLGVPYRINYKGTDFENEIKRLTNNKGVDVVINTLPGDAMQKGLNCLSTGGRYIEIAMTAMKSARKVDLSGLVNNQTFYSIDLRRLGSQDPEEFAKYYNEMVRLVDEKVIKPTIHKIYSFEKIQEAYKSLENRENIGKIVVNIPEENLYGKNEIIKGKVYQERSLKLDGRASDMQIAIIGMSGRFAKSGNVEELWKNLSNSADLVEKVTRWDLSKQYSNSPEKKNNYCNYGSFLEDIDKFDSQFFNISGAEALYMDPQQRVFLEESWNALEDAGYIGKRVNGISCGVYVGCCSGDYQTIFGDDSPPQAFWGNACSVIPGRVAYFLNLQGPAISIDTACSSSLVAIHLACQGLGRRETDLALAGGVFIQSTPIFYSMSEKAQMLSLTQACHTFDENADGFVPGEGAGVIVLKRLKEAIDDGDHIYGVIRGSGINQDGATNGITAPSLNSQERLERYVYDTFNINPEKINMVEAHGTGTKLGDPIEYEALTKSFRNYTDKKGFCAIGSIKTNLGHTVTAAGIAGVIKVLLSMKYRKIPASLHFKSGNSNINFKDSPFYVNAALKEWDSGPGIKRYAAVSSFGFSGTNAHLVIEEAPQNKKSNVVKPGFLIVLSARTPGQLQNQAERIVRFAEEETGLDIGDMSYTLLLGRKHFKHRLACAVQNRQELLKLIKKWLEKKIVPQIFVSEVKDNVNRDKAVLKGYGNECILKSDKIERPADYLENLSIVADLYTQGLQLDYEKLFSHEKYYNISLPTYPFSRDSYWIDEAGQKQNNRLAPAGYNHILLQENTSDFSEQRFSSIFTGDEFFLADHVVNGQKILPGVIYLEMARAAVESASGLKDNGMLEIKLKNVVWLRPVIVSGEPVRVNIALTPGGNEIKYEIYSESDSGEEIKHSQGTALIAEAQEGASIDIEKILNQNWNRVLSSGECYDTFKEIGINYGPGHRGIETVYVGDGEILARLIMPSSVLDNSEQFILHPSIMDSAIQSLIGLVKDKGQGGVSVPFALEEVEIKANCDLKMWALLKFKETGGVKTLNIDICNETGKVCIRMKGLSLREIESRENTGIIMFEPDWREELIIPGDGNAGYTGHLVFLCETEGIKKDDISPGVDGTQVFVLNNETAGLDIGERFREYSEKLIEELQSLLKNPLNNILIQIVLNGKGEKKLLAGLLGILKSARLENPKIHGQLIELDGSENIETVKAILKENAGNTAESHVRYDNGKRSAGKLKEIDAGKIEENIPWKDGGVYLITGGAGGLGRIISADIAEKAKGCVIVLTGRSALSKEKDAFIKVLEKKGAKAEYRQADVSRIEEVKGVMSGIQKEHGKLDGIIHIAGVNRDSFIMNKSAGEIGDVMGPKVKGVVNLDEASRGMEPDLFIMFSSIAGVRGGVGQADYAAANAFMDGYAKYRQGKGKTISIDWPLWKEGGMKLDPESEKLLRIQTGMSAMGTGNGIKALYRSISLGKGQVIVMEGDVERMKNKMFSGKTAAAAVRNEGSQIPAGKDGSLLEKIQKILMIKVSGLLKVKIEHIDIDNELSEFGFDSIALTGFAGVLNQEYGLELSPALFFEFKTLRSFSEYLLKEHREAFEMKNPELKKEEKGAEEEKITTGRKVPLHSARGNTYSMARRDEPVAIVGMSGIFPGARDLDEFWNNLKQGKDCISEIPEDRWDWRKYYGDPQKEANKTNIKWGGFIEGLYEFDPLFFGISPREARLMDPQQRLLMKYAWKVIEDAGYSAKSLSGTMTGIFVGTGGSGFGELLQKAGVEIEGQSSTGVVPSVGPNRMSYFLDIHGPSEPIETACSSSLIAIHRAVCAIGDGSCEMAIAGGVNTIIAPEGHISFSKAGMLCEDGHCKSFSDKANGYVRGEGAGMLFLKKLRLAKEDGNHIYGVIRSTAENHGGRSNSLTAPNPKAQADLIAGSYKKAGIDPDTVTYIEAHGTGTPLGDPIEIKGLEMAFRELYESSGKTQNAKAFCGIGTVKSNIGHLELAAGVAGVIKVLLQLKHKTLIKSLNCETVNPYIDLKDSPFYIVQENKEWKALQDGRKDLPRRAGVSSFGFGGANAHIVIEEYTDGEGGGGTFPINADNPAIIALSAKNEERLREKARDLLAAIEREGFGDDRLADITYTLQVGREGMEERLGFTAVTIKELKEKLGLYIGGGNGHIELYLGQVKKNKEALSLITADAEMQEAIDKWIQKGKYEKLIDLWAKGLNFDWNKLYNGGRPGRISLPSYPFARDRYQVEISGEKNKDKRTNLHPFVQENVSSFIEQRFVSEFSGGEFFIKDNKINGKKVFPSSAYLEMARFAVETAAEIESNGKDKIVLSDVVWAEPLIQGEKPVQLYIALAPGENGEIIYEIYSGKGTGDIIIHNQGVAGIFEAEAEKADLKTLRDRKWDKVLSPGEFYGVFSGNGMEYGPGYRGLEKIYVGQDDALASLQIPPSFAESYSNYKLHPSIMESVTQAFSVLKGGKIPVSPISLKEIEIYRPCEVHMWALIRLINPGNDQADIDLIDESGNVCLKIKGLVYQRVVTPLKADTVSGEEEVLEFLKESLAGTLLVDKGSIDPDKKFIDFGLDAVIAVEWIKTINNKYKIAIVATKLFDYKNVGEFADYVAKESKETVSGGIALNSLAGRSETTFDRVSSSKPKIRLQAIPQKTIDEIDPDKSNEVMGYFIESLAKTLFIKESDIDPDENLIDMGLDVVLIEVWAEMINKKFGTSITTADIYDYPTLREFVLYSTNLLELKPGGPTYAEVMK